MISLGASDLHLKSGVAPVARVHGVLTPLDFPPPKPAELEEVAHQVLTPAQKEQFESTREVDFAFGVSGLARFRANFFVQRGSISMVYRHVSTTVPRLEDLN